MVFLAQRIATTKPVVTYELTEWNDTPIKGSFYEQDFQKVVVPDDALFRVDSVETQRKSSVCRLEGVA